MDLVQFDLIVTPPAPFSSSDVGLFHAETNDTVVAAGSFECVTVVSWMVEFAISVTLECFVRAGWQHASLDVFVASHGG